MIGVSQSDAISCLILDTRWTVINASAELQSAYFKAPADLVDVFTYGVENRTLIIEEIYYSLECLRLFPEEQKECHKGTRGLYIYIYIYIYQHIVKEVKTKQIYIYIYIYIAMALLVCKNAYDIVLQT